METGMILAVVVTSPVVFCIGVIRWFPENWLRVFGEAACALGKLM
jgi:hypothetical protein